MVKKSKRRKVLEIPSGFVGGGWFFLAFSKDLDTV